MSLHTERLDEGEWWACLHPERPYDGGKVYDDECPACCLVAARADLEVIGDVPLVTTTNGVPADEGYTLADLASGEYLPRATKIAVGLL